MVLFLKKKSAGIINKQKSHKKKKRKKNKWHTTVDYKFLTFLNTQNTCFQRMREKWDEKWTDLHGQASG